jgi:glycosyltransferase involved in cell wall biosynthesis
MRADRTITVVIPVFNRAKVLGAAVESALAQELPDIDWDIDLIVVDDASDDDVAFSLSGFRDRLRIIRQATNLGAAAARNTGIAAARGDYVAFLDSDDVWLPGKLRTQVPQMLAANWPASCTAFYMARTGAADLICPTYRQSELGLADMVWGCFFGPGSTLIVRREVFEAIGTADPAFRRLEDWDWSIRYATRYPMGFVPQALARHFPSRFADKKIFLAALDRLQSKHSDELPPHLRRQFAAAIDIHRASAFYRSGERMSVLWPLLQSLWKVPFGNIALTTILHNRLGANKRTQ